MIRRSIDKLLQEKGLSRKSLLAVAPALPGITDVNAGVVIATSYLMGWRDIPLQAMLESALGVSSSD